MNEQAERLIAEAGEKVLAYLEATEGFAVEQAPLLAQEIVRWGIWSNAIPAFLFLFLIIPIWVGYRYVRASEKDRLGERLDGVGEILLVLTACAVTAFPLVGVFGFGYEALKALTAPRLYLLEQIGGMLG